MAAVTDHRDDHLAVLLVLSENAFEAVAEVVEVRLLRHLRLDQARLEVRGRARPRERLVDAHATTGAFEEV